MASARGVRGDPSAQVIRIYPSAQVTRNHTLRQFGTSRKAERLLHLPIGEHTEVINDHPAKVRQREPQPPGGWVVGVRCLVDLGRIARCVPVISLSLSRIYRRALSLLRRGATYLSTTTEKRPYQY